MTRLCVFVWAEQPHLQLLTQQQLQQQKPNYSILRTVQAIMKDKKNAGGLVIGSLLTTLTGRAVAISPSHDCVSLCAEHCCADRRTDGRSSAAPRTHRCSKPHFPKHTVRASYPTCGRGRISVPAADVRDAVGLCVLLPPHLLTLRHHRLPHSSSSSHHTNSLPCVCACVCVCVDISAGRRASSCCDGECEVQEERYRER